MIDKLKVALYKKIYALHELESQKKQMVLKMHKGRRLMRLIMKGIEERVSTKRRQIIREELFREKQPIIAGEYELQPEFVAEEFDIPTRR